MKIKIVEHGGEEHITEAEKIQEAKQLREAE